MDFDRDPIVNVIHRGIKQDIRLLLDNHAWRGAILLTYAGMDTLAYLAMPSGRVKVERSDFIAWADQYVHFDGSVQLSGEELYAARCATLHSYGTESYLNRTKSVRQVGYMDKSDPPVRENARAPDLVLVSVPALAAAFFTGVDRFLIDAFSDSARAALVEGRFEKLIHALPAERDVPS